MKSLISACATYDDAVKTVEELKQAGYNEEELSLVNKEDIVNNHISIKSSGRIEKVELGVVIALGALFGLLVGKGLLDIPGLHFLRYDGAWVGALIGLIAGILAGEVLAILTTVGINEANAKRYEHLLNDTKYLVFVQGDEQEIENAAKIAHTAGLHFELSSY